jgi:deazaflavin-dependent oxidoreductase (nitroreductase family)
VSPADVLEAHRDDECCMFTTTGRRSGRPHRIEIWFGVAGGALYLISGNGPEADWFQNALADPQVTIELGDDTLTGVAARVTDDVERREVGDVMGAKYPWEGDPSIGLTRQKWCYEVPLLRIRF